MRGRSQGSQERIIVLAHQIEAMARRKVLKDVHHYLPKANSGKNPDGAMSVLAMLRAMKARQDGKALS